jgi:2-methylcitrate dehydratase PrpD
MNGLLSALLAKKGFTGDEHIFEGETGFCKAMAREWNLEKITAALPLVPGNFRSLGNSYKLYASCRHTHPAIDAVLKIVKTHDLDLDEIKSIRCRTYSAATRLLKDPTVRDSFSAKFSLPYCIAVAVKDKKVELNSFLPPKLWDHEVRSLMERIQVEVDPSLEKLYPERWPAEVEIVRKEGQSLRERVDYPKGDPENPISLEDIIEKYHDLAVKVAGDFVTKVILEKVMSLMEVEDMSTFFNELISEREENTSI